MLKVKMFWLLFIEVLQPNIKSTKVPITITIIYLYFGSFSHKYYIMNDIPGGGCLSEMALGKLSPALSPSVPHSGLWKSEQNTLLFLL